MSGLPTLILPLIGLLKIKYDLLNYNSMIWKFHYVFTAVICFASSTILTANEILGQNICCFSTEMEIPKDFLDLECWLSNTFKLKGIL